MNDEDVVACSVQGRRRMPCSLRRRLILKEAIPDSEIGKAMIIRWIGAAAKKQGRSPGAVAESDCAGDNVLTLTWDQTFGRPVCPPPGGGRHSAVILALQPRT